jgi:two-component system chemotaxis response regulator CheB
MGAGWHKAVNAVTILLRITKEKDVLGGHDIIVVGASAGGVEALTTLVRGLPADLPAAVFVVLHIPPQSSSMLPAILDRAGPLPAHAAIDGLPIARGHIYVAPPDHHLIVERERMRVVRGPRENRHRPAVDVLFRSAAWEYGPRVVGVVLTGTLDDGTAGLWAIKQRGGIAVVQDPDDALYPGMPRSALAHVDVDHSVPVRDIAPLLQQLAHEQAAQLLDGKVDIMEQEVNIAKQNGGAARIDPVLGQPSAFSCPKCGGVLHEIHDGEYVRFRCRVGHAFSAESVLAEQSEALEMALWTALNTLEESISLNKRMAQQARERGQSWLADRFDGKRHEAEQRVAAIRQVLITQDPISLGQNRELDQASVSPGRS